MNVIWSDTAVHCLNSMGGAIESFSDHNETATPPCAPVRAESGGDDWEGWSERHNQPAARIGAR